MDAIKPIIVPVAPYPDESLVGLLHRVAQGNHYDKIAWLLWATGVRHASIMLTGQQAADLARLLDLPQEEVFGRAFCGVPGGRSYLGSRIHAEEPEWTLLKRCPDCIRENGYHSAVFDLRFAQVCPLHARRLVTHCHGCGRPLKKRSRLDICTHCRADLLTHRGEEVPTSELHGLAFLAKAAGFPRVHPELENRDFSVPRALSHLDVGHLIDLVQVLGACGQPPGERGLNSLLTGMNRNGIHRVLSIGHEAIAEWPNRFEAYMRMVSGHNLGSRRANNLYSEFGSLWRVLWKWQHEPWDTVRKAFVSIIDEKWDPRTSQCLHRSPLKDLANGPSPYLHLSEVKKRTGLPYKRAMSLVRLGLIKPVLKGKAFDREWLDQVCPPGKPLVTISGVKDMLGLNMELAYRLVGHGVIQPILDHGVDGHRTAWYASSEIESLVMSLTSLPTTNAAGGPTVRLDRLLQRRSLGGISAGELFTAIRDGRMSPVGNAGPPGTLGGLLFDALQAEAVMNDLGRTVSATGPVTVAWVANQLKVCRAYVQGMVRHGVLARTVGGDLCHTWICRASVEAFQKSWVTTEMVAARHGVAASHMRMALEALGIEAVRLADTMMVPVIYARDKVDAVTASEMERALKSVWHRTKEGRGTGNTARKKSRKAA